MSYTIRNHKLAQGNANVPFIKSPNIGGSITPKFLVIHYTASGPGSDIARYFSNPAAKVSAHLVVRRDGSVSQCVPFDTKAWHAGKSRWVDLSGAVHTGLNSNSIGIEIENWGPLRWNGSGWLSWTGAIVDPALVAEARHKFGTPDGGWETFTEAQVETVVEIARAICDEYGIREIVGHDDIAPGRKSDPGPMWKMDSFLARVFGRSTDADPLMIVRSATGLNLRAGPGVSEPKLTDAPLPDGTKVRVHQANGQWRFVTTINANGDEDLSGWVHGNWLFDV